MIRVIRLISIMVRVLVMFGLGNMLLVISVLMWIGIMLKLLVVSEYIVV